MKVVFNNKYIQLFKFESFREFSNFKNNQIIPKKLELDEPYGNTYFCYISYDSLTQKKIFLISFCSYQFENNLNILIWQKDLIVLDTGANIYFINDNLHILASFKIITPLIGLYLTRENTLLILEEASVKLVDSSGQIIKSESFDLIEDFSLEDEVLSIKVNGEMKTFRLN